MGRSARYGQEGSYNLVIRENDLNEFGIAKEDLKEGKNVYNKLVDFRRKTLNEQFEKNFKKVLKA
jgi:hypothetical protein